MNTSQASHGPNRLGRLFDRTLGRWIPRWSAIPLIFSLVFELMTYYVAKLLIAGQELHIVELPIDRAIPQRYPWIAVYFGAYVFWGISFILVARRGKLRFASFFCANLWALIVCGIVFVVYPTMIERPPLTGDGFWTRAMQFLYDVDTPVNILPSIHCMASLLCALGLHSDHRLPVWYRGFTWIFALMVCASTLLVKQHCVVDVVCGCLVAAVAYAFYCCLSCQPVAYAFEWVERKVFGG